MVSQRALWRSEIHEEEHLLQAASSTNAPKSVIRATLPFTTFPTAKSSAAVSHGFSSGNFKGKCDLVSVDIFDKNCNFITYVEYLLRVLYSAPGHLRDVKKSVCSAEVDECTEICNILNNTLNLIAYVDLSKKLFLFLSFLSNEEAVCGYR